MAKAGLYNITGKKVGDFDLNDAIFGIEPNVAVMHAAVKNHLANCRQGTQSALTRAEVSGGGRKPWRQKGTGRARQGSIRAPQWRHGGVVFAPKPRDFSKKINKKMRTQAFKSAISQKLRQDELFVVDKLELAEGKTRLMAKVCEGLDAGKKALFVIAGENENVVRATRNLADAAVTGADILSVYDLVASNKVYLTVDAIKAIEEVNA